MEDGVISADHIISALPAKGKWGIVRIVSLIFEGAVNKLTIHLTITS